MKTSALGLTAGTSSKPKTFKNLNLNVAQQAAKATGPPKTTTGVRGSLTVIQGNLRVTKPVGAAAAPVPVNTPSIRKEKGEEFDVSLVPSGKSSVWGSADIAAKAVDAEKSGSIKATSWADIDSDDDDIAMQSMRVRNLNQEKHAVNDSRESRREPPPYSGQDMRSIHDLGGQRSSSWRDNGDSRASAQYGSSELHAHNPRQQDFRQNYMNDNRYGDDRMHQYRNNDMPPQHAPTDPIEAARHEREQLEMKRKYQDEQKQLKKRQLELEAAMRANGLDPDFYRGGPVPPAPVNRFFDSSSSSGRNDSQYGSRPGMSSINNNNRYVEADDGDRWERGSRQQPPPPPQPLVSPSPAIHVSKIQTRERSEGTDSAPAEGHKSFRQLFAAPEVEGHRGAHAEAGQGRVRQHSDDYDERAMRGGLKVNAEDMDRCEIVTSKPKMLFDPKSNKMVDLGSAVSPVKSAPKPAPAKPAATVEKKLAKKPAKESAPAAAVATTAPDPLFQVDATDFKPVVLMRPRSVSEEKDKLEKVMAAAINSASSITKPKSSASNTNSNTNTKTTQSYVNIDESVHPVSDEASRKARLKEKAERSPRTAGLLFRYNKFGQIEEVMREAREAGAGKAPAKKPVKVAPAAEAAKKGAAKSAPPA